MGKNDFDVNFDYDDSLDFDPKSFLDTEDLGDDVDFSQFTDEELGLSSQNDRSQQASPADATEDYQDLNLDAEDLEADFDLDADLDRLLYDDDADLDQAGQEEVYDETDDPAQDVFADPEIDNQEGYDGMDYAQENEDLEDETDSDSRENARKGRARSEKPKAKVKLPKIAVPNVFGKFFDVYFAPVLNKELREPQPDPNNPRRRRKKSPMQVFKEVYLPPLIACVCLVMVLSFSVGAISNFIREKKEAYDIQQSHLSSSQDAAAVLEQEIAEKTAQAAVLAQGYDYNGAIELLDTINNGDLSNYPDLQKLRGDYISAQAQLVEYNDFTTIPNLSFHLLIEDPVRAYAKADLGGKYNQNFVSTAEFRKILTQLYDNGYVLVDFDSFSGSNTDPTGNELFSPVPLYLPANKKPVMITQTLMGYQNYMTDSNEDGVPDANGAGFAHRLVVQNGTVKAEYIDAAGQTLVGDYDLVPILETFIQEHPDFSYQGARAILAPTGHEGIFGYRCITDYVAEKGQDYVDQQVAGAKQVVQALRDAGYTLASNQFANEDYKQKSVQQISADLQSWLQKISPVIGDVDVLIFAQASGITDYNGEAFKAIYNAGFRYIISCADKPMTEINTNYVRQNRLMVTGETMAWYSARFNGLFDCNVVLETNLRSDVPKAG